MAKTRSYACPTCGAPLTVAPNAATVICQYCSNAIHVDWTHRAPTAQVPPMTLYAKGSGGGATVVIVLLGVGLAVASGLGVTVVSLVSNSATTSAVQRIAQQVRPTSASFPMVCGLNEKLLIADKTFEGTGTLITGEINCKVTIRNCRLKGDVVVLAKNLVEVELVDSTLEGTDVAIKADMNSKIRASGKTKIVGRAAAIDAGMNTEITLTGAHVESPETAIRAKHNLKLEARGGVIESKDTAIRVDGANPDINLTGGVRVVSKTTALECGYNLNLAMQEATLEAGEIGVEADANAHLNLRANAKVRAGETALKLATNAEVTLRNASITGERVALCAGHNTTLEARDSTIESKGDALRLPRRPERLDLSTSKVVGKQLFSTSSCGP